MAKTASFLLCTLFLLGTLALIQVNPSDPIDFPFLARLGLRIDTNVDSEFVLVIDEICCRQRSPMKISRKWLTKSTLTSRSMENQLVEIIFKRKKISCRSSLFCRWIIDFFFFQIVFLMLILLLIVSGRVVMGLFGKAVPKTAGTFDCVVYTHIFEKKMTGFVYFWRLLSLFFSSCREFPSTVHR